MHVRPALVPLAVGWVAGALVSSLVDVPAPWPVALALLALAGGIVASSLGGRARNSYAPHIGWLLLLAAGALCAGLASGRRPQPPPVVPQGLARITGSVERTHFGSYGPSTVLRVEKGAFVEDEGALPTGVRVRVPGMAPPRGSQVRVLVSIRPRVRFHNPTPHPPWPRAHPIAAEGRLPEGARPRVLRRNPWWDAMARARQAVRSGLEQTLEPRTAGLARAWVLGERNAVSAADQQRVRTAGLAHVLAVSGLHVAIVAGLFVWGLGMLLRRIAGLGERVDTRRLAAASGIPVSFLYAAFAGGAPSAWRAAVTASVAWLLIASGRRPHALAVVAAAALVLGVSAPDEVVRPAFLLSVTAVASIVTIPRPSPPPSALYTALAISARTTLATAPLVLWCFGHVPAGGVVANVLLLPLGSVVLIPLAVLHAGLSVFAEPLTWVTGPILSGCTWAFVRGCALFSDFSGRGWIPPPSVAQGLVLTLGCWGVLLLRQWWLRALLVFAALLGLGAGELALRAAEKPEHGLRLTFVDVGQGDSTLVDLPDGRAMLVDAAGASFAGPDPGERALLPLLRARRRDHLAVVALTHPHPDHFAGLESLLGHIQIGEVWVSGQALAEQPHGSAARLLGQVRAHGIPIRTARKLCGRARLLGGARVDVLSPCPGFDAGYAANDNSLVLRLTYGRERALLAGDIERASERRLLREGADLRADVLKVPHHGSRTSSTTPFLRAVSPRYAVVSCGRANRFGHPHPSALTRLRATAGTLVRTDRSGGVVLRTRGHGWQLETWRGDRPP